MATVDITDATVATVARRLLGSAGPGGVDSISLQHWLLWFGVASMGIRQIVGESGEWMTNGHPPWAVYRALMLGCLIGLDKCPGVRPVGVGGTWRWMLVNCMLAVAGVEANEACGKDQICGGLDAGIEGGIHAVRLLWKQHSQEEEWGFLFIDTHNAFNEENHTAMLWAVCHKWPSGERFSLN